MQLALTDFLNLLDVTVARKEQKLLIAGWI